MINKKDILSKIDLAVIISITLAISYGLTYLYNAGIHYYYGLPFYFIEAEAKDVFFTMLFLGPIIIILLYNVTIEFRNKSADKDQNIQDNNNKEEKLSLKEAIRSAKEVEKNLYDVAPEVERVRKKVKKELNEIYKVENEIKEQMNKNGNHSDQLIRLNTLKSSTKEMNNQIEKMKADWDEGYEYVRGINKEIKNIKRLKWFNILLLGLFIITIIFLVIIFTINANYHLLASPFFMIASLIIGFFQFKKKYTATIIAGVVTISLLSVGYGMGLSYAKENYYFIEKDSNKYIVLTTYKDQFLYASINEETNIVEKTFSLINIQDVEVFYKDSIGRIQLANSPKTH